MKRAVFLDRDGVINRKPPEGKYVTCCEEFQFIAGVREAISLLNKAGYEVLVITNQRCVAKGLLTVFELESMHEWMCRKLAAAGAVITKVYYCPHEEQPPCGCRKPAPGMLLAAARAHEIDLRSSWMIGDSEADIEAGTSAGCRTIRILRSDEIPIRSADMVAQSLLDAAHRMLTLDTGEDTENFKFDQRTEDVLS